MSVFLGVLGHNSKRDEPYMVKCDDCKKVIRYTSDVKESYQGDRCKECRLKQTNP